MVSVRVGAVVEADAMEAAVIGLVGNAAALWEVLFSRQKAA